MKKKTTLERQQNQQDQQSQIAQAVSQANLNSQANQVATTTTNGTYPLIILSISAITVVAAYASKPEALLFVGYYIETHHFRSIFHNLTCVVPTTMDNSMGQMVPMTSLALSQSMDSVNTATNEEEVSAFSFHFFFSVSHVD